MALSQKSAGSHSTLITESTTGNDWRVVTTLDNTTNSKRVTAVSISFSAGANDAAVNCSDSGIKDLHDAIVAALVANIGSNKGTF